MHGVFSPFIKNKSSYSVRAMSGRDIMTRPVWNILTEHGGKSIVVNVPTTYPPEPINGLMVTGMLTPVRNSAFTYPDSLKTELLNEFPNYVIEPERIPDKHARANEFRRTIEVRERALRFLMQRDEWDFLMVVFSVLDRAQHDYWADMDPQHPRHDPNTPAEFRDFIHEIYQRLDSAVGSILERLPANTSVLIVSDHGFCSELVEVRVNELLASAGLLTFKSPGSRKSIARIKDLKQKVARRFPSKAPDDNVLDKKVRYGSAFLDEIDWSRTRAFFAQDKGVWINLVDRENAGIVLEYEFDKVVEETREVLSGLTDPVDGNPVFERIMRREEAFSGIFSSRLPDLVMIPSRDEYVYNERPSYGDVIVPADSTTGTHSRDGIFIAWGSGINSDAGFAQTPNLRDVGPTALCSLGCPLTKDMDGRVLDVFKNEEQPQRQGSSYKLEEISSSASAESVYSPFEETELRERLKALGYIK